MVQERRTAQRFRAYLPVRLRKQNTPQVVETLTKDLSTGGLRCVSPTLCPVATDVTVELMMSIGEEPLLLRGKTAWFRAIPESEQFEFGVTFSEFSPQSKRRLSAYLERLADRSGLIPA